MQNVPQDSGNFLNLRSGFRNRTRLKQNYKKIIIMNYDIAEKTISEKIEEQLEKGDKISQVMDGLEIKPNGNYTLIKPYLKNPYEKIEVRESGIILTDETPQFKNPDSGEKEEVDTGIKVARVIEVGPDCKYVKEGDDVYYYVGSTVPVPFFRQGFYAVAEPRILMILNKDLTKRFNPPKFEDLWPTKIGPVIDKNQYEQINQAGLFNNE
jgi:hypothetical protein